MTTLKIILYCFSFLLSLVVLLPLIKKDFWIFRVFDYPRLQKFVLISIVLTGWLVYYRDSTLLIDWGIIIFLSVTLIHLAYVIVPFTFLGKTMVDRAE
ncbi:MAG: endonuclease/exonuclease/phosphatase family protein, partial [Bacteroidetes bacterium]|nr:endonuclease/exonuclease/phosphatase family protein [Bacteroidota bacterium]